MLPEITWIFSQPCFLQVPCRVHAWRQIPARTRSCSERYAFLLRSYLLLYRAQYCEARPNGVKIFHWHNPSGRTMALGSTQPLTEMSTRNVNTLWTGDANLHFFITTVKDRWRKFAFYALNYTVHGAIFNLVLRAGFLKNMTLLWINGLW
jgi:hypothetical protein